MFWVLIGSFDVKVLLGDDRADWVINECYSFKCRQIPRAMRGWSCRYDGVGSYTSLLAIFFFFFFFLHSGVSTLMHFNGHFFSVSYTWVIFCSIDEQILENWEYFSIWKKNTRLKTTTTTKNNNIEISYFKRRENWIAWTNLYL